MTQANDLESVSVFIESVLPSTAQIKNEVPSKPTKNTVVVRMLTTDTESETRYHYRIDRAYQVVIFGEDSPTVLERMDTVSRKVNDKTTMIPILGTLRYIRTDSFAYSAAFRTESGLWACVGVLQTEVRQARTQEQYDKIMHVYPRYELRIPVG
ncbi:hypothetical protein I532_03885 [Brevibacillus borstelensis AK1]|uniref:Uncharacterized protein n=1 Tax=Brevibacillus borstelensis AK1 TaxID=1300222 RepID=M8EGX9_9BACL|nr:hypothetical protein [Brevibacillus borstelensis]EMT54715.1 hypothetical protein I532_03885 [Brevibacillus borstelensis AK1]